MSTRSTANVALLIACACWGLSFPLERALFLDQLHDQPELSTWCLSAWGLCLRFTLAAGLLMCCCRRSLGRPTTGEWQQGLGLGVLTAAGMLLQMDALMHATASTVAFLSQCYAVWIPLVLAIRDRRLPELRVLLCVAGVLAGVAILSGVTPGSLTIGRGEGETILSSLVFTVQILWAERRRYAANRVELVAMIAFAVAAVAYLPLVLATAPSAKALIQLYADPARLGVLVVLASVTTCLGLLLMFRWQRYVGALTATIIYCTEPIYAAVFAIVLPAGLSALFGIVYAAEAITGTLLLGGGLIIGANLLMHWHPRLPSFSRAPFSRASVRAH